MASTVALTVVVLIDFELPSAVDTSHGTRCFLSVPVVSCEEGAVSR